MAPVSVRGLWGVPAEHRQIKTAHEAQTQSENQSDRQFCC